ncbi:LLM class flavin-dependent oxidoreductase [Paracraurococcus lichenis]|uniref:LLM class flavin-dependent oxidoreductase n=1 Tax=Paracraurococcus lichenis TaxID=3064888 RepID=A0ABT9E5P3_9PROT|nr:LLM class flavin-dependent oxidoreductase [Paracraurococcus sp. LOR1-02]MDO9711493.1 LLM class flavin-dependent oxidoreductase [Paracraurococcus sp. LOR1-02]
MTGPSFGARRLKLGLFVQETGHHLAAWRHPAATVDDGVSFARFHRLARLAEEASLHFIFLADTVAVRERDPAVLGRTARATVLEPLTLLGALAVTTERIGLIATASTTYNEPYNLARQFASLDHLSGGRVGWNLVTTNSDFESWNFNRDANPLHADRYARAKEFAKVVRGLWDSFDDDALRRDKPSGIFFPAEAMHTLHHEGPHFRVRGPLNLARPPQGHPVIVQAGSSDAGRELAAETAEVIFTAQQRFEDARVFYADVKHRLVRLGRRPEHLSIMPGLMPVIGRSRAEAEEKFAELQALIHPSVALSQLANQLGGVDLSPYDPDGPVPDLPETNGPKSRQRLLLDLAQREGLTLRQLALRNAGARGHWILRGTPADIADEIEHWFRGEAADGFNLMPPVLPRDAEDFVRLVLPELRRRGLFRDGFEGRTLRENLGLPRPPDRRHAAAQPEALP